MNTTISYSDAVKFPFVLKLWLATKNPEIELSRWNVDKTALMIDVEAWNTHSLAELFTCNTIEDFLWLLRYNGFQQCSPTECLPIGFDWFDGRHLSYRHPRFVGKNHYQFAFWLNSIYLNKYVGMDVVSMARYTRAFGTSNTFEGLGNVKAKVMTEMKLLNAYIQRFMCQNPDKKELQVAQKYTEYNVTKEPEYMKMSGVSGNYGFVDPSKLGIFYEIMQPIVPENDCAEPVDEVAQKEKREEDAVDGPQQCCQVPNSDLSGKIDNNMHLNEFFNFFANNVNQEEDSNTLYGMSVEANEIPKEEILSCFPEDEGEGHESASNDGFDGVDEEFLAINTNTSRFITESVKEFIKPLDCD